MQTEDPSHEEETHQRVVLDYAPAFDAKSRLWGMSTANVMLLLSITLLIVSIVAQLVQAQGMGTTSNSHMAIELLSHLRVASSIFVILAAVLHVWPHYRGFRAYAALILGVAALVVQCMLIVY